MAAPKIYAPGQAKERQTPFGPVVRWGVKVEDLIAFAQQHVNERGFINVDIVPRRETGRYGETHSVVLDTYVKGSGQHAPSNSGPVDGSDLPFAWMLPLILPALLTLHGVLA